MEWDEWDEWPKRGVRCSLALYSCQLPSLLLPAIKVSDKANLSSPNIIKMLRINIILAYK